MKAFFGTTTKEIYRYKKNYLAIRDYLVEKGIVIMCDWLERAIESKKNNPKGKRSIKKIFKEITNAIEKSDFVIIELTAINFSSAHQIQYSLQRQKPTLVMRLERDNTYADSYIEGVNSKYLTIKEYDLNNYKDIIDEFIGFAKLNQGYQRYNVVLEHIHKYYLDWAHEKYQESRSKIVRDALEERMKKDDDFKKYIV